MYLSMCNVDGWGGRGGVRGGRGVGAIDYDFQI